MCSTRPSASQPRLRHELGHQIRLDRLGAAFRAVAGILDAAERGLDRGEAVVVDRDGADLEAGRDRGRGLQRARIRVGGKPVGQAVGLGDGFVEARRTAA